jgi:hypothetical protein
VAGPKKVRKKFINLPAENLRESNGRHIYISLIDLGKGEAKAQTCDNACYRQLTNCGCTFSPLPGLGRLSLDMSEIPN